MFHVNFVGFVEILDRLTNDPNSWVYVDVQWQQDGTAVILIDNVAWFAHKPVSWIDRELISLFKKRLFISMDLG